MVTAHVQSYGELIGQNMRLSSFLLGVVCCTLFVFLVDAANGELKTVFKDGVLAKETSLAEIRQRLKEA